MISVSETYLEHSTKRLKLSSAASVDQLPPEVLSLIFQGLDLHSLLSVSMVSRKWRNATLCKSIWSKVCFKIHQEIILPELKKYSRKDRSSIARQFDQRPQMWILETEKSYLKVRLIWPLPCERFLNANRGSVRFQAIQAIDLSSAADQVSDFFFRQLIKNLPNLRKVNINSCYKLGNKAIHDLVRERRDRLEELLMRRCFGLSFVSLVFIAQYCRSLKVLDVSDGCGAVDERGLMSLVHSQKFQAIPKHGLVNLTGVISFEPHDLEDLVEDIPETDKDIVYVYPVNYPPIEQEEVPPIMNTLRTLRFSASDFVESKTFKRFFQRLSRMPNLELQALDVCMNFNLTDEALDELRLNVSPSNKLHLDIKSCDQLTKEHIVLLEKRTRNVVVSENCKLFDNSEDSVRDYLRALNN